MKDKIIAILLMLVLVLVPFMILKGRYDSFVERNQAYFNNSREYFYENDNDQNLFEAFINKDSESFRELIGSDESPDAYYIASEKFVFNNYEDIPPYELEKYLKDCPLWAYSPVDSDFVKAYRVSRPFNIKSPSEDMTRMIYVDAREILKTDNPNEKLVYVEYLCSYSSTNAIPENIKIEEVNGGGYEYMYIRSLSVEQEVRDLADEIRTKIPIEKRDDLKSLVESYVNWITGNLYYIYDYKESMGVDNNLSNSVETLKLRAGVCQDFSWLLSEMLRSQNIPSRLVKGVIPYKSGLIPNDLANYESHINLEVYDGRTWFMINPTLYNPIDKNKLLFNVKGMDKTVIRGMTIDKESEFKFIPFVQVSPFSSTYTEHFKFNLEDVDFLMYTVN